jgi:protein phosphatase
LGDFIDRGEFSTETLTLVLVMKVLFPASVFVIRGNHEFGDACVDHHQLTMEFQSLYGTPSLLATVLEMFAWMPIAADVDHYALAVHGGIGPTLRTVEELDEIQRPIVRFEPKILEDLMWSDPTERATMALPSPRGLGVLYGVHLVSKFLEANNYSVLVRGHQCVQTGIQVSLNSTAVTVFGASSYCGDGYNRSGVLCMRPEGFLEKRIFPPIPYLKRFSVLFSDVLFSDSDRKKGVVGPKKAMPAKVLVPSVYGIRPSTSLCVKKDTKGFGVRLANSNSGVGSERAVRGKPFQFRLG